MRTLGNFSMNWVPSSIGAIVRERSKLLGRFATALVTCVDSTTEVAKTANAKRIVEQRRGCTLYGEALLIPGIDLAAIAEAFNLFAGFDEIWFFDGSPKIMKPPDLWIISPMNLGLEGGPPLLVPWMTESGCILGLGDGIGLNYITRDFEVAKALDRD